MLGVVGRNPHREPEGSENRSGVYVEAQVLWMKPKKS